MPLDISIEEELERRAGLKQEDIPPPIKEKEESDLTEVSRWKTAAMFGLGGLLLMVWFWWSIVEPRLHWFAPKPSPESLGTLSKQGPGDDSSFLHADENLVKSVQNRLNKLGFRAGRVDGVVGPRTMEAVERFQLSQGIPVTGIIDRKTKAALDAIEMPKGESNPYMIARARREKAKNGARFIVDLSMDPALSRKDVERHIRRVTVRFAKSNPDVNRFHVRGYLGIASLSAGAYAIADWSRKGKNISKLEGITIRFQEWTRKDVEIELPPAKSKDSGGS